MLSQHLLGDDPVDASGDELDRKKYSKYATQLINRVRTQTDSSVIALVGPWGSGKSSVLAMIKESIDDTGVTEGEPEWRVAEFNPWIHSDPVSMYVGFYSEIRSCLPGKKRWKETRESISGWLQTAAPLGKLGGIFKVDMSSALEKAAEKIAGGTSAAAKKDKAEDALREAGLSILVIMDDLDRLTPDELLEVFKLIRLVGRLPNVHYLLSFDERTLIDVLCRTELAYEKPDRARDYLEKMIQVRLDIPALREKQSVELFSAALQSVCESNGIVLTEAATRSIASLWFGPLSVRLNTPRSIKRFFGQFDASYGTVKGEVDFIDFAILTFLRTNEPRVYAQIQSRKRELTTGESGIIAFRKETPEQKKNRWNQLLTEWGVAEQDVSGVLKLLATLFAPIRAAANGVDYIGDWLSEISRKKGVGHEDYFDRYFSFGVPLEDIPDQTVKCALSDLSSGLDTENTRELFAALTTQPGRAVRKIQNSDNLADVPRRILLRVLADAYPAVPDGISFMSALPRVSIEALAEDLLVDLGATDLNDAVDSITDSSGGYCLAVRALWRARMRAVKNERGECAERFTELLKEVIGGKFIEIQSDALPDVDQSVFGTIHQWMAIDGERVKNFLRESVRTGKWSLLEVLDKLVNRGTSSERSGVVLMGLEAETVESALGLSYVFEALKGEIDAASTDVLMEGLPDNAANRRDVALAALSFARARESEISRDDSSRY
ncbi:P-loop NTPase fold protein [Streptomyces albidoflavus]